MKTGFPLGRVDFRAVKAAVSMAMALSHYGLRLRQTGPASFRGRCPLPGHASEKSGQSFAVDTAKNVWACQSATCIEARGGRRGGTVLDFVAFMEGCSLRDAATRLRGWFSIEGDEPTYEVVDKTLVPRKEDSEGTAGTVTSEGGGVEERNKPLSFALKGVDPSHPHLAERGIDRGTAERFGLGYFPGRGLMRGRIVIPIHNERGDLVAYAGRAVDGKEPKYKLPAGFKASQILWNLHRVITECGRGAVVLVEGFFGCISVFEAGYPAAALMGKSLSGRQEALLEPFERVIVMLDGDAAGRQAGKDIALRLVRRHFTKLVEVPEGKQPDGLTEVELDQLLVGEGRSLGKEDAMKKIVVD